MGLATDVTNRYPNQYLVNLTNPMGTSETSVNTTILGHAVTDVEADFEIYAGIEYDSDEPTHVTVGVDGVVLRLLERTGKIEAGEKRDAWIDRLRALARVTSRNRILPDSNSVHEPSEQAESGQIVRPAFDDEIFDGMVPGSPR